MALMQGLQFYNDKMLTMAEHWDEFIMDRTLKNPNIWHDRITRGKFELFNGQTQKSNIYRGGLPVQAGLATWKKIGTSRKATNGDPGFDNCAPGTPHTYGYAWETIETEGFQDEWQSEPICLEDMKYIDKAPAQLALVVRSGVEYGVSILENWNREMYLYYANRAGRCVVMTAGSLEFEDNEVYRFSYDPFLSTTDADGDTVPYIKVDPSLKISTLNWSLLDYLRTTLADKAGEASLAKDSGLPVFGLMLDMLDFERFILTDDKLRDDFRYAQPRSLIDGYDFGIKVYRGFGLIHDARQARFRFKTIDAADGKAVYTRIKPVRLGREVTIGQVPEPNPQYYRGELGIGVIYMNEVFTNLFVPSIDSLGSGTQFGPAPGLTGEWKWINIQDPVSNLRGDTGNFYGRFQIYPKPLMFSQDTTVFLYRRCVQQVNTVCVSETDAAANTGAVALKANAVAADIDVANRQVTVTLVSKIPVGPGSLVSVVHVGSNSGATAMYVVADSLAPKYTLAWKVDASNLPTAFGDFTAAGATVDVQ